MGGTTFNRLPLAIAVVVALALSAGSAQAATIEVDVTNDELNADGDCSLREAVQAASTNTAVSGCTKGQGAKADTVKLVPGEPHALTIASTDEDANVNGDLDFSGGGPVTVKGNARAFDGPTIEAPASDRAIEFIDIGGKARIEKLNLDGGNVAGLGSGDDAGGVVRSSESPLAIDDINVEGGHAVLGGGIAVQDANLTLTDSFIGDNSASVGGGGVLASGNRLTIARSGLDSNDAETTDGNALGGGVLDLTDRAEIVDTDVTLNNAETTDSSSAAARGGGIYTAGQRLLVRRSRLSGNDADDPGGTSDSTGAGIAAYGDKLQVLNSTFTSNAVDGTGGAIVASAGASVTNTTFASNGAGEAGDIMAVGSGPLRLRNSILETGLFADLCAGDPGDFVSKGFNLFQFTDSDCGFIGRDVDVDGDMGLDGSPANHGGHTFTIPITASSPAKDAIPKRYCKPAKGEDQRGYKRPKGKKCDAGAFERGAEP